MPVLVTGGAANTAAVIQQYRRSGLATRRRRMPRFRWPTLIEVEYAKAIARIVDVRDEIAPLLDELPRLLERAASARGQVRRDEGEARRARDLMDRARRALDRSMNVVELERLAGQMGQRISDHHRAELRRQVQAAIGVDLVTLDRRVPALIDDFVGENVTLIRSLGNKTLDDVNKIVSRAFTRGERAENVAGEIAERYGIAERHARLIARDQIGTLTGQITAARHQELGLTQFTWRSVNDQRVRPEHRELDGKVFDYDDPPGEGLPGEPINCRCYQEPIFDEIDKLFGDDGPSTPRRRRRASVSAAPRRSRAAGTDTGRAQLRPAGLI